MLEHTDEEGIKVKALQKSAASGDLQAQADLGSGLYTGYISHDEQMKWCQRAAERGHVESQFELGMCFHKKAQESVYKKSHLYGFDDVPLGATLNPDGSFTVEDEDDGWDIAAELDQEDDLRREEEELNLKENIYRGEAFKWIYRAAQKGYPEAQYYLGTYVENDIEAADWLRLAANQGLRIAQYRLGVRCQQGRGVAKDLNEALKWFRLVAETEADDAEGFAQSALPLSKAAIEKIQGLVLVENCCNLPPEKLQELRSRYAKENHNLDLEEGCPF